MSSREQLHEVLPRLSEADLDLLLGIARRLQHDPDREEWLELGRNSLARAYGDDEPDYGVADIKPRESP